MAKTRVLITLESPRSENMPWKNKTVHVVKKHQPLFNQCVTHSPNMLKTRTYNLKQNSPRIGDKGKIVKVISSVLRGDVTILVRLQSGGIFPMQMKELSFWPNGMGLTPSSLGISAVISANRFSRELDEDRIETKMQRGQIFCSSESDRKTSFKMKPTTKLTKMRPPRMQPTNVVPIRTSFSSFSSESSGANGTQSEPCLRKPSRMRKVSSLSQYPRNARGPRPSQTRTSCSLSEPAVVNKRFSNIDLNENIEIKYQRGAIHSAGFPKGPTKMKMLVSQSKPARRFTGGLCKRSSRENTIRRHTNGNFPRDFNENRIAGEIRFTDKQNPLCERFNMKCEREKGYFFQRRSDYSG